MATPKKELNRPKKRTLVRWDDDLDELLLLTIQSVCNKNNVKIPWAEVATTMKHGVTEGAIVQHLAKLRSRRVNAGKAVPPPLRRGGIGSSSTKASGPRQKRKQTPVLDTDGDVPITMPVIDHSSDEDYIEGGGTSKRRLKRGLRTKATRPKEVQLKPEPQSGDDYSSYDSDTEELLVPGAVFLRLPNDRETAPSPSPSVDTNTRESKVVVLKYSRTGGKSFDKDNSTLEAEQNLTSQYTNLYSNDQFQEWLPNTSIPQPLYNNGLGNDRVTGEQYTSYSTLPHGLSPLNMEYGHTALPDFDSSMGLSGLPNPQWNYLGNPSGGPSGTPHGMPDLASQHEGLLEDDNYAFLYGSYVNPESNEEHATWAPKCE